MAAYSNGNAEFSVGQEGGLQTMVLMNPTTAYAQFNSNNSTPHALHAPPHQQQQFDGVSVLHAYVPPHHHHHHSHYNNPLVTFNSGEGARGAPRAGGLSLSLSSSATCFGGMGNGNGNGVVFGVQGLVMSSKFVKAAQELLDEVVSVDNGGGGGGNMHQSRLVGDGDGGKKESKVGDETDCGGGATGTKVAAEITAAERQEIQTKKAKLISMLDEVDQRYRQYKQQMQTVISSFEQAAGPNSAKTYTSLALKTISKQFRTLKDTITSQIRAANKTLGEQEEDRKKEGESSSRLKFVDHHLRQQRALQQLGMTQHNNAWRPQRGLPERAVSVLRAWLFEHFLHPYPKDSDKIILAKQTGLTRSQVSNWFINARVRLWKPMVEEMYIEEMKDQETSNGSETGKNKQQQQQLHKEDSASNLISFNKNQEQQSSVLDDQGTDFRPKQETFMNSHSINPSISVPASVSAPHRCGNLRNPSGFLSTGPLELIEGITQWRSPKKPRSSSSIDNNNNKQQFSMELRDDDETQYSFVDNNTNFVGGFETGRFEAEAEADQFHTPRYSGNGVLLTLGLPHCDSFSVSGTHQNFLPNQNIQQQPDEFGSMSASVPHSSAAYDTISIQNQRRFVAQLLPDYVS